MTIHAYSPPLRGWAPRLGGSLGAHCSGIALPYEQELKPLSAGYSARKRSRASR